MTVKLKAALNASDTLEICLLENPQLNIVAIAHDTAEAHLQRFDQVLRLENGTVCIADGKKKG